jgi:hypothetical protein
LLAALVAPAAADGDRPIRMTIAAGKVGEACMPLAVGDTLVWQFTSNVATDFNLHHHVGKDVLMPVDRKALREDRGEHTIDRANDWCLMWTAPKDAPATITGAWLVRKAGAPR